MSIAVGVLLGCLLGTCGVCIYVALLLRGERYDSSKYRALYWEYKEKYTNECDRSEEARVSRDRYKGLLSVAEKNVEGWTDACNTYRESLTASKASEIALQLQLELDEDHEAKAAAMGDTMNEARDLAERLLRALRWETT